MSSVKNRPAAAPPDPKPLTRTQVGALAAKAEEVAPEQMKYRGPDVGGSWLPVERMKAFAGPGVSKRGEQKRLDAIVSGAKQRPGWNGEVLNPADPKTSAYLKGLPAYETNLALTLMKLGRTSQDVQQHVVEASGTIRGQSVAPHKFLMEEWKPKAPLSDVAVVVSPGFQMTTENYSAVADAANARGMPVFAFNHQWADSSELKSIDSAALDVDAAVAKARAQLQAEYGDEAPKKIVVLGESMGGAATVEGLLANASGGVKLKGGGQVPKDTRALLLNPFLGPAPNLTNTVLNAAAKVPIVRDLAEPAMGVPVLTRDPEAAKELNSLALIKQTHARLRTFPQASEGLATLKTAADQLAPKVAAYQNGELPPEVPRMTWFVDSRDKLANPKLSQTVAKELGAKVVPLNEGNHVISASPSKRDAIIDAIVDLAKG